MVFFKRCQVRIQQTQPVVSGLSTISWGLHEGIGHTHQIGVDRIGCCDQGGLTPSARTPISAGKPISIRMR